MCEVNIIIEGERYQEHPLIIYYDVDVNGAPWIERVEHAQDKQRRNIWKYFRPSHWSTLLIEEKVYNDCNWNGYE